MVKRSRMQCKHGFAHRMFFTDGIRKFMDQSNKCVEKLGDYIKQQ
jgi:hypothetical protein